MTHHQTLDALTYDLILEVYELAACMKAREQLSDSGNDAAAHELMTAANASSIRILELSKVIQTIAEGNDRGAFGMSVDSLLQQLPQNLGASTRVQLQAVEEALGLPTGATIGTLRTAANTGIEPSRSEDLWKIAFMVGLATLAAAGVGAPLAALATHQAVGQIVLEEAIITFGSVAIVETAIAVKNRSQGNPSKPEPPWYTNIGRSGPSSVERPWRVLDSEKPVIGTNTDRLQVAQRGRRSPEEQAADDTTIAAYNRRKAALRDGKDPEVPNPWARYGDPSPEHSAPESASGRNNPEGPSRDGGIPGP